VGREGIRDYFREGKGKLTLRGEVEVEESGRQKIWLLKSYLISYKPVWWKTLLIW
jgi:DNA gyrase/topoisomerase IV subunit A